MSITLLVKYVSLVEHPLLHRRVKSLHGQSGQMLWEHSRELAIENIRKQHFHYFFHRDGLAERIIVAEMPDGEPFLKAVTDGELPTALLLIPVFNPILPPTPTIHERKPIHPVQHIG